MSWLFASDDQNTRASASPSGLPVNIQGWSPLRLTGLISLMSKRLSGLFSSTTVWRHQFFGILLSLQFNYHNHMWPLRRPWPWLHGPLLAEYCLCFSTHYLGLSWLSCQEASDFRRLLISWFQSPSAVILELKKRKSVTTSPFICHEVIGPDSIIWVFLIVLNQLFPSPPSPSSRDVLVPLHFLPLEWYYLHIWDCWGFSHLSWFQLATHPAQYFPWCAQCIR